MTGREPEVLIRLPESVRGRRRSAPGIERTSDVTRTRGWLVGSVAGGLGLLAAVLLGGGGRGTLGPSRAISRPHVNAGLDCASCHGDARPGPATAEHDPADACVTCHRDQRSTRAPHAALLASKRLRCTTCHAIHSAMGGVAFEPGATPIRWRTGFGGRDERSEEGVRTQAKPGEKGFGGRDERSEEGCEGKPNP